MRLQPIVFAAGNPSYDLQCLPWTRFCFPFLSSLRKVSSLILQLIYKGESEERERKRKERERQRENWGWARMKPTPRIKTSSPAWVAGSHLLESCPAASKGTLARSWNLEKAGPEPTHCNNECSQFNCYAKCLLHSFSSLSSPFKDFISEVSPGHLISIYPPVYHLLYSYLHKTLKYELLVL